jgi:hypothetical protein
MLAGERGEAEVRPYEAVVVIAALLFIRKVDAELSAHNLEVVQISYRRRSAV